MGSIQAQTIRDLRIIVVNDGCTDETSSIIARLAATDPRIVLLEQPNSGIVDALNVGLAAGRAEFVARFDADDLSDPDRFEKQLAYLRGNPDCSAVSGAIRHVDQDGQPLGGTYNFPSTALSDVEHYPQREPYLSHPFLMVRRAAIEAVGGYRHVFLAEDSDLYWRLQELGRLHNMPDVLGAYRVHARSITGSSIVNGRISAVNSQRAGISAMRRRAGKPDLAFPKSALPEYRKATTLEGIVEIGSRDLDTGESRRLAVSTCAKLLELTGHRPYELEAEDCTQIAETLLPALETMSAASRRYCRRLLSGTATRLASKGRITAALSLVPVQLYLMVMANVILRSALPTSFRQAVRRVAGRDGPMK